MTRFLIKRLFFSIFVLLGISILIFALVRVIPGDPARMALGDHATAEAVEQLREEMHLNDPMHIQYYYWISGVFKGNFGASLTTGRPVSADVADFLPATLELVIIAGILQLIFAFALGIISATFRDTWIDGCIRVMSYICISVPGFVWAVLFLLFFGFIWQVIPVINRLSNGMVPPNTVTGMYAFDYLLEGNLAGAWDAFLHMFLPALSLAIGHIFQESRILRSSLIDNMNKEFISVTTGYGIPRSKVISKYLLKPSAISMVTIAALDFSSTLGNAFLVETVFNWPGISRYCLTAMMNKDLNAVSVVIIIIGLVFLIANIVVDLVIAALDPRVRLGD